MSGHARCEPECLSTHHIAVAAPFDFDYTIRSHGWVALAPNRWDADACALERTERLASGRVVRLKVTSGGSETHPTLEVEARHAGTLSPDERREITASLGWMLRVDEDYSDFYALCRERGGRWMRLTSGLGRLLRSPTLFEDVVRTVLTTNIQWSGTVRMARELVGALGETYPFGDSFRAFPTPQSMAATSREAFVEQVRLGYRGPYVHELACQVAAGSLNLEALRETSIPTPELRKQLLAIKGVGSYSAATLLMLLGHYDDLGVDTEFRQFVGEKYFAGQRVADAEAKAIYEDWGRWKYLAYWFDIWGG